MLIKPWNETAAPRHYFEDDDDQEVAIPDVMVPKVTGQYIVIIPNALKILGEFNKQPVGEITITYNLDQNNHDDDHDEEYDEDEQLYHALNHVKYPNYTIPVFKTNNVISIVMPHIANTIVINQLCDKLINNLTFDTCICLAPSNIEQSLNKLDNIHDSWAIPMMKPPHFITGVSASMSSKLYKSGYKFHCLILRGEGQPGFELVDSDAMVDAAEVLQNYLKLNDVVKSVSSKVRKFSYNSGMYI